MTKIDPKSAGLLHQALQQTFGRYTVHFKKTMNGVDGGKHYNVVIRDVENQRGPLEFEFSTGSAWAIPPATNALSAIVDDYFTVTVDPNPSEFEPEVWERLEKQAEKFRKSALFDVFDLIDNLVYELGIDFEFVAPFLIDSSTIDDGIDVMNIPVRGDCRA